MPKNRIMFNVRMPAALLDEVKAQAEREDRSASSIFREAVRRYLADTPALCSGDGASCLAEPPVLAAPALAAPVLSP